MSTKRVVILGGGFGGLSTAHELLRLGWKGEVVIVDKNKIHVYTPWLYEVATGLLENTSKKLFRKLKETSGIDFTEIDKVRSGARFRVAVFEGIDFETKHILLEGGKTLSYDYSVIAIGSEMNYFGIKGLKENSFTIKTLESAVKLQKKIKSIAKTGKNFTVVVGGAGPAGVEFTAELANFFKGNELVKIKLLDASDSILRTQSIGIRKLAKKRLKKLGVEILLKTLIEEVDENKITAHSIENGKVIINYDILVWSGGIKPRDTSKVQGVKKDKHGCLSVNMSLQILGMKDNFAIGDVSSCVDPKTGLIVPKLAQMAIKEGKIVAQNILNLEKNGQLQKIKISKKIITINPLGGKYGVMEFKGIVIFGVIPYFIHRLIDLKYFFGLFYLKKSVSFWLNAENLFEKND